MRRYSREDVEMHRQGYYGSPLPAVNVKSYSFIPEDLVIEKFGCSHKKAENALRIAWECACEDFWDNDAAMIVEEVFGKRVSFWSEGRSGGWLVVKGLPEVSEWDAIALGRWRKFETCIRKAVAYMTSREYALDMIEMNGWADPDEQDPDEVVSRYSDSLNELRA